MNTANPLQELAKIQPGRTARIASTDPRGKNRDYWRIAGNSAITIADIEGPGCINHMWLTSFCKRIVGPSIIPAALESVASPSIDPMPVLGVNCEVPDPEYYRKVLIKITWDNQENPSVLAPFGDFFGVCNCIPGNYESIPFNVSVNDRSMDVYGAPVSMNCYFAMPFNKHAKIEIINENDIPMVLFFMIDYELKPAPYSDDVAYFHAQWVRQKANDGWGQDLMINAAEIHSIGNTDGKGNFVMLETEGEGHFVGFNMAVISKSGNWWGEGNDMVFIDGEEEPSIVGTGGEDVFNLAWGFQHNQFHCIGNISGSTPDNLDGIPNQQVAYRFYIYDPIRFEKSLKFTLEHGHANHLSDDWSCTTYWYQKLNNRPISILPLADRLPLMVEQPRQPEVANKKPLTKAQEAAKEKFQARYDSYMAEKKPEIKNHIDATVQASKIQAEKASKVHAQYKAKREV